MAADERARGSVAVLDVAGVSIALFAADDVRADIGRRALAAFPPSGGVPVGMLVIDGEHRCAPEASHHDERHGVRFWSDADTAMVVSGSAVVSVQGAVLTASVPDLADEDRAEGAIVAMLAWLLAPHGRYLVHGAAVSWGADGLVVLGHTGAGKSTLIAAALEHGWRALADDLVIVAADREVVRVVGVNRHPAIPTEIGGPVVARGRPVPGPRGRAELPSDVLSEGSADVRGVVLLAHARSPGGELARGDRARMLTLLLQSFPATGVLAWRTSFLGLAARLQALPVWQLALAADVGRRRHDAGVALEQCRRDWG